MGKEEMEMEWEVLRDSMKVYAEKVCGKKKGCEWWIVSIVSYVRDKSF